MSVNVVALSVCSGASSTPAIAAMPAPSAHDIIEMRPGRPPFSIIRERSSTTARIAMPSRVKRNISARAAATTIATPSVMRRW